MFCSRCGHEVQKATQFCPSCGLDLRVTTPIQAIATGDVTELDIVREALQGEYEILEELGRGGMAIVYRAMDKQLGREVAIKVLPFSLAFDADFVERFQREARTAAQLEHPNIIPIYRVGKAGRVIYFVMKYLRGIVALPDPGRDGRKLTPSEIQKILVDVGSALGYAAARGTVHRDVKPDNIMFDEHGLCVVTDFGIAKAAQRAAAHRHRHVDRHAALHEPGAGAGPGHRRPERHLQPRDRRVSVPGRRGALRRGGQLLDRLQAHHGADPLAAAERLRRRSGCSRSSAR